MTVLRIVKSEKIKYLKKENMSLKACANGADIVVQWFKQPLG